MPFRVFVKPAGATDLGRARVIEREKTMKDTTRNALDFANPGPLPTALMDMPGFVNGLKEYTLRTAPRPNEVLAFAGALAMLRAISRDDQNPVSLKIAVEVNSASARQLKLAG